MNIKQVIVVRKDLNMRKGKIAAQVAHASMKVILDLMTKEESEYYVNGNNPVIRTLEVSQRSYLNQWLDGKFTKVCVSCDSEAELLELRNLALQLNIHCSLITDAGLTEFNGVPTNTCIAIGPASSEEIDKITGHLKLL